MADEAQLVVSELVANAVEHAGTEIDVTIRHHRQQLRIAVADRHPDLPRIAAEPTGTDSGRRLALRGRGLALVTRAAERWGVLPGADGKIVWASLPAPRRSLRPNLTIRHRQLG